MPAYAASKGAIARLTQALSNEWAGQGVQVNAIAPGYVATDLTADLLNDEARATGRRTDHPQSHPSRALGRTG